MLSSCWSPKNECLRGHCIKKLRGPPIILTVEVRATVGDKIRIMFMVRATVIWIQVKQVMEAYTEVRQRLHEMHCLYRPNLQVMSLLLTYSEVDITFRLGLSWHWIIGWIESNACKISNILR